MEENDVDDQSIPTIKLLKTKIIPNDYVHLKVDHPLVVDVINMQSCIDKLNKISLSNILKRQ